MLCLRVVTMWHDGFVPTLATVFPFKGLLPELLRAAGFVDVKETGQITTIAGALSFYSAQKAVTQRVMLES